MKIRNIAIIISVALAPSFFFSCQEKRGELKKIWYNGSYNRDFNDLNDVQLAEAKRIGINPLADSKEAEHATRKMVEISTNDFLLEDIGRNFQDTLRNRNASLYKIKVTSVTRTSDDVKRLRKRNTNSSANSTHQYGTTFDISWVRYSKIDENDTLNIDKDRLKMVLAMVLRDLKREERCYVKHERRQGCFHITVRSPKED